VGEGDRIATTLPPSLEFVTLLHALPRIGAALVPLDTRLPSSLRRARAEAAGARLMLDELPQGFELELEPRRSLDPQAIHTVLFTSGTSGAAKPVELTLENHDASAAGSAAALGVDPDDRWLSPLPLSHVAGIGVLVRSARNATTAVLHDRFEVERVRDALERGKITLASLVATMLGRLRAAGLGRGPALRALVLGGGPIPPDLIEWARAAGIPVRCTYGMTETASQIVVTPPWELAGEPFPSAEVRIADDGEILVRGAMVATAAAAPDGWLRTGDSGRLDRDGRLHVEGRLKDLIATGGEKVAPAAVEAVLLAHPAIADAGVAGLPDPEWGEAVTAFVRERTPVSDYDLLAFCRDRLAGYEVPKRVVRVARLPRNAAGKLLRRELGV
jgi:O-succinylbenzoic acid--CoA ligase